MKKSVVLFSVSLAWKITSIEIECEEIFQLQYASET